MSLPTQPSDVYTLDSNKTNAVRPSSGRLSDGWATDDTLASSEFDHSMWMTSSWASFLSAWFRGGDVEANGLQIDSVSVTLGVGAGTDLDLSGSSASTSNICRVLLGGTSTPYSISGIKGSVPGRVLILQNCTSAAMTFTGDDGASSSAGNRFRFPTNAGTQGNAITIAPLGYLVLVGTDSLSYGWSLLFASGRVVTLLHPIVKGLGAISSGTAFGDENSGSSGVSVGNSGGATTVYISLGAHDFGWFLQSAEVEIGTLTGGTATGALYRSNSSGTYTAIAGASGSLSPGSVVLTPTTPTTVGSPLFLQVVSNATGVSVLYMSTTWIVP